MAEYWDNIKNMEPTMTEYTITILRRDAKEEIDDFKQRVFKHCEWLINHDKIVFNIKYEMVKRLARKARIGKAVIYHRRSSDNTGTT